MSLSCQSLPLSKHSNCLIHSAHVSLTVFFAFFTVFSKKIYAYIQHFYHDKLDDEAALFLFMFGSKEPRNLSKIYQYFTFLFKYLLF